MIGDDICLYELNAYGEIETACNVIYFDDKDIKDKKKCRHCGREIKFDYEIKEE